MFVAQLIGTLMNVSIDKNEETNENIVKFVLVAESGFKESPKLAWFECSLKTELEDPGQEFYKGRFVYLNGDAVFAQKEKEGQQYPYVHVFVDKYEFLNSLKDQTNK